MQRLNPRWAFLALGIMVMAILVVVLPALMDSDGENGGPGPQGPNGPGPARGSRTLIDLDVDTDRDGRVTEADDRREHLGGGKNGAIVLVNCDDDDGDRVPDNWKGGELFGKNPLPDNMINAVGDNEDIAPMVIRRARSLLDMRLTLWVDRPATQPGRYVDEAEFFKAIPAEDRIRIFLPDSPFVISAGDPMIIGPGKNSYEFTDNFLRSDGDFRLGVEGLVFGSSVDVILTLRRGEEVVEEDRVTVTCAPLLLISNDGKPTRSYVAMSEGPVVTPIWNGKFVSEFNEAAAAAGVPDRRVIPYTQNRGDVWIQDEIQFGYQRAPTGTMIVCLDANRDRGLKRFPRSLMDNGVGWAQFKSRSAARSRTGDGFGNLEVSPPVTVGGRRFPFGRITYGSDTDPLLESFLIAQKIQAPVKIDTSWLTFGRVDELLQFVHTPAGLRVLVPDPQLALRLLKDAPDNATTLYSLTYDRKLTKVSELQAWTGPAREKTGMTIEEYNRTIIPHLFGTPDGKGGLIDLILESFGLGNDAVVRVPVLFRQLNGRAAALTPNLVNSVVIRGPDGTTHLLAPKPWLAMADEDRDGDGRLDLLNEDTNMNGELDDGEDLDGDGRLDYAEDINLDGVLQTGKRQEDPFETYLRRALPGVTVHFIDTFAWYHVAGGGVHGGSNILRQPPAARWYE